MKALIVDADPVTSEAVRGRAVDIGIDPIVTATAAQAFAVARTDEVALVILSLDLHDVDGLVACRRLARMLPHVPILAISTRLDETRLERAYAAGAHDLIAKPLRLGELAVRARAALRLHDERIRQARHEQRLAQRAQRLELAKRELERTACIDQVTGIANRRCTSRTCCSRRVAARRAPAHPASRS